METYVVGDPIGKKVRITDGDFFIGVSNTLENAKLIQEKDDRRNLKIYKLVEVIE